MSLSDLFGGSNSAERAARRQEMRELERQSKIDQGTREVREIFGRQFTPSFYDGIKSDYLSYYKPQLQEQYNDQSENLQYALARSGLLGRSSVEGDKFADLQRQMDIQKQQLADRANQATNQRRGQNQQNMDNVILQLQSTADQTGAAADAANLAQLGQESLAYEPLGQIFTDATAGLATQADLERRGQSRYKTGIFNNPSSSSGEVVT